MIFNILLVTTLIICCITDLRVRKIYNKVIFPTLFSVFILQLILNGFSGLKISLLGFLSGIAILIIPFALRGIGAGDVKLLALIGAMKGSTFALNTALYMFVIGGSIALIIVLFHRETINFFKNVFYFLAGLITAALVMPLLLLFLCMIIDVGRIVYAESRLNLICQESVRIAGLGGNYSQVYNYAYSKLDPDSAATLQVGLDPLDDTLRKPGTYATVTLTINLKYITPLANVILPSPFKAVTESTIRIE